MRTVLNLSEFLESDQDFSKQQGIEEGMMMIMIITLFYEFVLNAKQKCENFRNLRKSVTN